MFLMEKKKTKGKRQHHKLGTISGRKLSHYSVYHKGWKKNMWIAY